MTSTNPLFKKVHNALEEIVSKIEDRGIPDINCGGCGWFVYFILNELERYNISPRHYKVVYLVDWGFESADEIEYNLHNKTGKRSSSHLMLYFDSVFYDAYYFGDDFDTDTWYMEEPFFIDTAAEYMKAACQNRSDWNNTYDYKRFNSQIRRIVYSTFRKYLKNE